MWQRALNLDERRTMTRPTRANYEPDVVARGRQRLARWQALGVLDSPHLLAERLAADAMTEDEFLYLLGMPADDPNEAAAPAWYRTLSALYTLEPAVDDAAAAVVDDVPDLGLLGPVISFAFRAFDEGIADLEQRYAPLPFSPSDIRSILQPYLISQLQRIVLRTLALQVNVKRLLERLQGDTPAERHRFFIASLRRSDEARALLCDYPVLGRVALHAAEVWVETSLELLTRLSADLPVLQAQFGVDDLGLVSEVESGAGDAHRGGRTVTIVRFSSGFALVYKPRPMHVDLHMQNVLAWINEHGDQPPYRTVGVLARDGYGWMEYVQATPCTSDEELKRYYARLGGLIALLFALEAVDFHAENVIAAGDQPILVDLESLFHQRKPPPNSAATAQAPAVRLLMESVMRLGILPRRIWRSDDLPDGIDITAMADVAGMRSPVRVLALEREQTDEMRIVRKYVALPGQQNVPVADGAQLNLAAYLDDLVAGFATVYRLLMVRRAELLAPGGIFHAFVDDEVRVVLRPTIEYDTFLADGYHPHVLRDGRELDLLLDRLWDAVKERPSLAAIIRAEQHALWAGDIPAFTAKPGARTLYAGDGQVWPRFFAETGFDAVRRRLDRFGEEDLARQLWFIRGAVATSVLNSGAAVEQQAEYTGEGVPATQETLLDLACAAADRLDALALRDGSVVSWLGIRLVSERDAALDPAGLDLYDGLAGITFFLAYLGHVVQEARYTELAQCALTTIRQTLQQQPDSLRFIGAFGGWAGLVYLYAHLGRLWRNEALLDEAEGMLPRIRAALPQDEDFDVIYGAAGAILALRTLHLLRPSSDALSVAVACGDHLLGHAVAMEKGVAWKIRDGAPLTGLAHGAAGIAWALSELAALSGESRFARGAQAALAYERSLFNPEAGNWQDLRDANADEPVYRIAWCHGAAGIGLARLRMTQLSDDPALDAEIATAVATTMRMGFGRNHSLCHGDLGNVELLFESERRHFKAISAAEIETIAGRILGSIETTGWRCGTALGAETPGLMVGTAGMGYQLLRLAEPDRVPSVLLLEPPRPVRQGDEAEVRRFIAEEQALSQRQ